MMYFTCDQCGKQIRSGADDRFIIRIEVFAAEDTHMISEADLDEDNMEAVSALLREMEDGATDEPNKQFRYDMCHECHKRFVQDPLGKENGLKLSFSKN